MDPKSLKDIFLSLDEKVNKIKYNIEKINQIYNPDQFLLDNKKLEKINNFTKELNILIDKSNELLCLTLYDKNILEINLDEKEMVRQYKLDEKILSIFTPLMLYARICLESQYNN